MNLKEYRGKIDQIDSKIVELLNTRANLSMTIGKEKVKHKKGIYAPDREKEVLERIKALNQGPMTKESFEAIYREIMSSCLTLEKSLKIAYMGPPASFSHLAARQKFGSQVEYVSYDNIGAVFQAVEKTECDYGVVPIENSIEGAVTHTFDVLVDSDLKICSEMMLEVSHNLLSKSPMEKIKKVYANPPIFGQCRNWLLTHLPQAERVETTSSTKAAQLAAKEPGAASIGSMMAAKVYNLRVIRADIEDLAYNVTRFLVVGRSDVPPTGKDRTSILFSIKDKVGALHAMLTPFEKNKINLTKIESRPSKKKAWDYYFFIDLEGHVEYKYVKEAIAEMEERVRFLKILGSYPSVREK